MLKVDHQKTFHEIILQAFLKLSYNLPYNVFEKKHVTFHEILWKGVGKISQKDVFIPTEPFKKIS